jgi:hypothetical protein
MAVSHITSQGNEAHAQRNANGFSEIAAWESGQIEENGCHLDRESVIAMAARPHPLESSNNISDRMG